MASNNILVPGTWGPGDDAAPGHATNELVVSQGNYADPLADPTSTAMRSARNGDPVALPYPEATYWQRVGTRGLRTAQPTILFDAGFAIMADGGSLITV